MKKHYMQLFIALLLASTGIIAQNPYLVKNLPTITHPSSPRHLCKLNNEILFFADDGVHGNELWKTNGTTLGTVLLKDINPNGDGIMQSPWYDIKFIVLQNVLYFAALDNTTSFKGNDLWRTDGTAGGTYKVKSFTNNSHDELNNFIELNNTLFFTVGGSLWKSDGTEAGTVVVKENIGAINFTVYKNNLYFDCPNSNFGYDLWTSDGTAAGTKVVKAFAHGKAINLKAVYKDKLYFVGQEQVWITDGTAAGTLLFKTGTNDSLMSPSGMAICNNTLFIGTGNLKKCLWKTDGSVNNTLMIKEFQSQYGGGPINLTDLNGTLYFEAKDSTVGTKDGLNNTLWKSDGTTGGTEFIQVINAPNGTFENSLTAFQNNLFMCAYDPANGYELWKSEGTTATTNLLKSIYPGDISSVPASFTILNDKLVFSVTDDLHKRELWITDGTLAGTKLLMDINKVKDAKVRFLTNASNKLFFSGNSSANVDQLWTSDGTSTGTRIVAAISPVDGLGLTSMQELNGNAYFFIDDSISNAFYKSDGTLAGTQLVKRTNLGDMRKAGNFLYGGSPGFWLSDGTDAGTNYIGVVSNPLNAVSFKGKIYLESTGGAFVSDGTVAGTMKIGTFQICSNMVATDNAVYFLAADGSLTTYGLWRNDGTVNGTTFVKSMNVNYLTAINEMLYFQGASNTTNFGMELWKSDGTDVGTVIVKDINPTGDSNPSAIRNINGTLYFIANDGVHGYELWKSDGTETGTALVKDISPGAPSAFIVSKDSVPAFTYKNGFIYFTANDGVHGFELWKSDGTEKGTVLYGDINSKGSSYPQDMTIVNQTLFYTAYEEQHGRSLWASSSLDAATCFANFATTYDQPQNTFTLTINALTAAQASQYYWDFGDGTTSTLAEPTHVYLTDGIYNLCVKIHTVAGDSCLFCHEIGKDSLGNVIRAGFKLIVRKSNTSGIDQEDGNEHQLIIYPNPATDEITISMDQIFKDATVRIVSVDGQVLIQTVLRNNLYMKMDLGNLAKGMYFIEIMHKEGIEKGKFIKN